MEEQKQSGLVSKAKKIGAGVGLALISGASFAQSGPDISDAVGAFTAAGTAIGSVGAAMVAAAGAGIVYRWVTAFLVK